MTQFKYLRLIQFLTKRRWPKKYYSFKLNHILAYYRKKEISRIPKKVFYAICKPIVLSIYEVCCIISNILVYVGFWSKVAIKIRTYVLDAIAVYWTLKLIKKVCSIVGMLKKYFISISFLFYNKYRNYIYGNFIKNK